MEGDKGWEVAFKDDRAPPEVLSSQFLRDTLVRMVEDEFHPDLPVRAYGFLSGNPLVFVSTRSAWGGNSS